jgi:hypothetical protein
MRLAMSRNPELGIAKANPRCPVRQSEESVSMARVPRRTILPVLPRVTTRLLLLDLPKIRGRDLTLLTGEVSVLLRTNAMSIFSALLSNSTIGSGRFANRLHSHLSKRKFPIRKLRARRTVRRGNANPLAVATLDAGKSIMLPEPIPRNLPSRGSSLSNAVRRLYLPD